MKMKVESSGPPAGAYTVRFDGIKQTDHPEYGDGYRWQFTVVGGPQDGVEVSRTTKCNPTAKNSCGKFLSAVTGQKIEADAEYDLDPFVGRTYQAIVADAPKSNSTRIENLVSAPAAGTAEAGFDKF